MREEEKGRIVLKSGEALCRLRNRAFAIATITSEIERKRGKDQ